MTPGELDHPAAHAGIARFGKSSLTSFFTTLVGRTSEARIAREGSTIPDVAREHLLHEHVRGLDADADDLRKQPYHRMALLVGRSRQAFGTGCLDFLDLLLDEAKAVHVALQRPACLPERLCPPGCVGPPAGSMPGPGWPESHECRGGR